MELIQKKILLEQNISRNADASYGNLTASTFNINIFLTQDIDNMGLYTDINFENVIPNYLILIDKLNNNGFTFPFMGGATLPSLILSGFTKNIRHDNAISNDWYSGGNPISGMTNSRINLLQSYNKNNRFIPNFNINEEQYVNYLGLSISGVSRVTNISTSTSGSTDYVFDTKNDINIGTQSQNTGLLFSDLNTFVSKQANTSMYYIGEGWNKTNTSLSALTKEEYLFGITSEPEVFDDVFIDRGQTTVMEKHLKLSEVESLEHLKWFGNGFYKINKV